MELIAGFVFAMALVGFSYCFNRWQLGTRLTVDVYGVALSASTVVLLAIIAESIVNPLYETFALHKLWEYRVFPLYDGNVSALGLLVWAAYGIHLHFTQQLLKAKLPRHWNNAYGQSFVIGFEAPFFFEISGNLIFLAVANQYYAYYIPGDVFHLTSLQVVPVYMVCVFFGLVILNYLERLPRRRMLPPVFFTTTALYLLAG